MNEPSNRRHTRTLAGFVLGATAALTACAPDAGGAAEESVAEWSERLAVGAWEWNDVPNTKCGNGSQTGFAINRGTRDDIVVYLEGGNYCWDDITCGLGLASFFNSGYGGATFASSTPRTGIFDRANPSNPYRNSTIVYVPYCTGDFHSGDVVGGANHTLNFNGRQNLELDLAKVRGGFPNPSRVTLTGSSAGGFGAMFNYDRVARLFANTRVDLVADSSPVLWNDALVFVGIGSWNAKATLPADCTNCAGSMRSLYGYYANKYPNSRFAFVGFDQDPVMSAGYVLLPFLYTEELRKLVFDTLKPLPNWKHFVAPGGKHTTMYSLDTASQNKRCNWLFGLCFPQNYGPTITLGDWLTAMYTDDPSWAKQSALIE